jgi:cytochrome c oxidase assembly protein subunit 15
MAGRFLPPSGLALDPVLLNFVQNPVTVQWMHRLLGTVLLLSIGILFVRVRRIAPDRRTHGLNVALLSLIASQYVLGVLTLIYHLPVALAVLHQAMAIAIVAVWVAWMHHAHNPAAVSAARQGSPLAPTRSENTAATLPLGTAV